MGLLHRIRHAIATWRHERDTYGELARLTERDLADLGLSRADIRNVARTAARQGPVDVFAFDDALGRA